MEKSVLKRVQTVGEEIANAISHGVGSLLSVAGMIVLIVIGASKNNLAAVLMALFYGISLVILYTASTLYHSLTNKTAKYVFRILDHCSIFLLISGTYAPISVLLMGGTVGYALITVNTLCAVIGIVLNAISLKKFKVVSIVLYFVMGWMCVFTVKPLINTAPADLLIFLLMGGIAYTLGIIFYALPKVKYMHFIWHLFVLLGSILQYIFVLKACYINL